MFIRLLFSLALLCTFNQREAFALHLHGQYSSHEFFRLLTKFGIQKTDQHRSDETFGYIYGNITVHCPQGNCSLARNMLFLILDYDYFVQVYNKQRGQSCAEMMQPIEKIAFDRQCSELGKEDFWRRVPCPENQLCPDEDQPRNVIHNQQFTFKIRDINQPRFWYLSFVSCYWQPDNCTWEKVDDDMQLNYDIWIVNGNPEASSRDNRFEYHFSFDMHDLVEIYSICILFYLFIPLPFVLLKMRSFAYLQHPILISYLLFQLFFFLGNTFNLMHYFLFAYNGIGVYLFVHIGNLITIIGESIFILLLLFIAKGWLVNTPVLRQGKKTVVLFVLYTVACCSCYGLSIITINRVTDSNHYQTFANYFSLLFRCFLMLLFVYELKETTQEEKNVEKLQFFHHFGACCMVWFVYPTALIFIMSFVTELYRVKLIISVVTVVNFLSILIVSYILFSPKTFLNLPKRTASKHQDQVLNKSSETNGYHKSSISEHVEDDEEDDIEVYGPTHLLLNYYDRSRLFEHHGQGTMSNTNGFHLPSTSIPEHRSNDVTNDLPRTKERLKPKHTILTTINQTEAMKGLVKKQNIIGSNNNLCHKLHPSSATSAHSSEHGSSLVHLNESQYHSVVDHDQTVSCHRCSASIHPRRSDLLLSNGGLAKALYICEHCQATPIATPDQLVRPFIFDPKKTLHLNRVKTHSQNQSTSWQIPLTTESNDRSADKTEDVVEAPHQPKSSSASNLKRKRPNCSSSPSLSTALSVPSLPDVPDAHLDLLHRLCLSYQSEEFQGPTALSPDALLRQPNCFICRKSASTNGPSLQCDYCPLIYHLDCLTPLMTSLPLSTEQWMCSNHFEPAFDRCFFKKKTLGRSNRVKIYNQSSIAIPDMIVQDFPPLSRKKNDLLSNTISNTQLKSIQVSQIPKAIENYYSKVHASENEIDQPAREETTIESCFLVHEPSSAYDPCIWDMLQDILDHLTRDQVYEFSAIDYPSLPPENMLVVTPVLHPPSITLDRLDLLLTALNESQDVSPLPTTEEHASGDTTVTTNTILQSMSDRPPAPLSFPSNASFSLMLDLSQFRVSHAALIDRHSEEVIYIRKHVVWVGSSSLNDICLNHLPACRYVTERHACLYYDRKQNSFELLNYSEYGTIVNGLRYGLGMASSNDNDDDGRTFENHQRKALENENRERCSCSTNVLSQSTWDGAAQIDQGTVIKIGCHEFLFYRHLVR